jgi:hypothetical protein
MKRAIAASVTLVFVLAGGCTAGTQFVRPSGESLELGKTTPEVIRDRLGKPYREGTSLKNGEQITILTYSYATAEPYVEKIPARAMAFYFHKDVLVGYEYTSSFDEDKTDFDDSKVSEIKKGETTAERVIELFGQPSGRYVFPMIRERDGTGFVYVYTRTDKHPMGGLKGTRTKVLIVVVDPSRKVADVTLNVSGPPK